jgi:hypothetical protein
MVYGEIIVGVFSFRPAGFLMRRHKTGDLYNTVSTSQDKFVISDGSRWLWRKNIKAGLSERDYHVCRDEDGVWNETTSSFS